MADGGTYSYDAAAAQGAEDRVESAARDLQTSVETLSSQLQTLSASWDGGEQQEYSGVHQKVSDGLDTITQTLNEIKAALADNTQAVSAMRNKVRQAISGNS